MHPASSFLCSASSVWSVSAKVLKIMSPNLMLVSNSKYIWDPYGTCSVLPNLPHMETHVGPMYSHPGTPMGTHIGSMWADTWDHLGPLLQANKSSSHMANIGLNRSDTWAYHGPL